MNILVACEESQRVCYCMDRKPWVDGGHIGGYGIAKSSKDRSKTFWGIARAMAEQWG